MGLVVALYKAYTILNEGGTALDAVEAAVVVLEDWPVFNAGRGSCYTAKGTHELDSSIMCGLTLKAGAVAGVTRIKNPISLARKVMEKSEYVLLSGEGAEEFAVVNGFELVPNDYFHFKLDVIDVSDYLGTVGCVARDKYGNLAAATSTGGRSGKNYGRIGDSPIIGAGTYANNSTCAISTTGTGELFIRGCVSYDVSALMEYKNLSLLEAIELVLQKLDKLSKKAGGLIGIDNQGNLVTGHNSDGMYRGYIKSDGIPFTGIWEEFSESSRFLDEYRETYSLK